MVELLKDSNMGDTQIVFLLKQLPGTRRWVLCFRIVSIAIVYK